MYAESGREGTNIPGKFTSVVVVMRRIHAVRFASRLQKFVGRSSEVAALGAHVLGLCDILRVASMCSGMLGGVGSLCENSAAVGIASRVGVGKFRHLQVKQLWTQCPVMCRRATLSRVSWLLNWFGALTHPCKYATLREHGGSGGAAGAQQPRPRGCLSRQHCSSMGVHSVQRTSWAAHVTMITRSCLALRESYRKQRYVARSMQNPVLESRSMGPRRRKSNTKCHHNIRRKTQHACSTARASVD